MTRWSVLLNGMPVFAMALAIVLVPLLADSRPRRRERREALSSSGHIPISEKPSANTHRQMAIADVHLAKVR
jgi:hypothetical protein